jgi:hypothetical protein
MFRTGILSVDVLFSGQGPVSYLPAEAAILYCDGLYPTYWGNYPTVSSPLFYILILVSYVLRGYILAVGDQYPVS